MPSWNSFAKTLGLACAVVTLGLPAFAAAFSYKTCNGEKLKWTSGNTITVRADPTSFPSASVWRSALQEGITRFNENPSNFRYSLMTDSGGVGLDNGQNEIWGTTDNDLLDGAPARAFQWWTCFWPFWNHMDEVDIVFDYRSPWRWTTSTNKADLLGYGVDDPLRPIQTTAIHELGHGLPLNHENTEYNVMGIDYKHIHVNGSTARAYLGEDVADGTVYLYGLSATSREDLGVVHWKYCCAGGEDNEYSDHVKTGLFYYPPVIDGNPALPSFNDGGETRYWVNRGQVIWAEFTYENNGASTQNGVQVGFYISTNATISTSDRRIGGTTLNLARNDVFTSRTTVTIPSDLVSAANYWLGVIIDENDSISEMAEWNNATYIPIRIN
jgi:hypothetical protein